MKRSVRQQAARAPDAPGVYLFKGDEGKILYVGKAKRLRERLKAYVRPERDARPSVALMVAAAERVEWLLTHDEKEALLFENSLIKKHRPRYNITWRDDKSYVSLKLTRHEFPRLHVTRKVAKDGAEYFGPYSSAHDLRDTLKLLQKLFLVRDCSDPFFDNRSRPCLRYQIKRCTAPCVNFVTPAKYAEQVDQVRLFLQGGRTELLSRLRDQMASASAELRYEEAARARDRLRAVGEILEPRGAGARGRGRDSDVIGLAGDAQATLLKVLKVRGGRLASADEYFVPEPIAAAAEVTRTFLQHHYLSEDAGVDLPATLYLGAPIADQRTFEELLSERRGKRVRIRRPKRGEGLRMLELARRNASSSLEERKRLSERNRKLLEELRRRLRLKSIPRRIEGYDVSNFQGAEPVGSMVVFTDGEPDKEKYRHYGIRTVKGPDDFAMLKEMFDRRFKRLTEENRPDLVLVDGGRGQLKQACDALRGIRVTDIDLASLAKEKELVSRSGKKYAPERVFLPGQKNPLLFPASSPVLLLLQRVRDEAHRFGLAHHRKARIRRARTSVLSRIRGVGPKRRGRLLRALGSLERVRSAGLEELMAIRGISAPVARAVFDFFRRTPDSPDE